MKAKARIFSLAQILFALAFHIFFAQSSQAAYWLTNSPVQTARYSHTTTLLSDGKVLVAGGLSGFTYLSSAELFDPATGKWAATGSMTTNRTLHTATLLPNGKVLVAGGYLQSGFNFIALSTAELYDPTTGQWTATMPMSTPRTQHTATLLANGKVLVVGGSDGSTNLNSAEMYDWVSGEWSLVNPLHVARDLHTATLLPDGKVLVTGGVGTNSNYLASSELFDPVSGTWADTGELSVARALHDAILLPNGKVLVAGGEASGGTTTSSELYNPATGTWSPTAAMSTRRERHSLTLLPNGKVLAAGGSYFVNVYATTELYDPVAGTWNAGLPMPVAHAGHTATLLANGRILIVAGFHFSGFDTVALANVESFDPANGNWTAVNPMTTPRKNNTATLLPGGNVLITGGQIDSGNVTTNGAEVFNPTTGSWTNTSPLTLSSSTYTTTLLANGNVLALGGNETNNAQMYDETTGSWTNVTPIPGGRSGHTATLLADGRVLIAGGGAGTNLPPLSGAIFDPKNGSWTNTGPLNQIRFNHTATLLSDGRVLVAGGRFQYVFANNVLTNAEIFDPVSGNWTNTGPLNIPREIHTATLVSDGRVLVVGGYNDFDEILNSAELYDPSTGLWTLTAPLNKPREFHTATLLPNGKVLVAGGASEIRCGTLFCVNIFTNRAELFDPVNGTWTLTAPLNTARGYQTATLLPSGKVLLAGGATNGVLGTAAPMAGAELYDAGLGLDSSAQPQIASANSPLNLGNHLNVTGSGFRGLSQSSTGNAQDSPGDHPIVQLRAIESGRVLFLQTTTWSTNSFVSAPVTNFPTGFAFVTVFVNGIPSVSRIIKIDSAALPTTIVLTEFTKLPDGSFQFGFSNVAGASFSAFATTNLSIPSGNWNLLGSANEIAPGHFQFTDSATNLPQRFYQVRSP